MIEVYSRQDTIGFKYDNEGNPIPNTRNKIQTDSIETVDFIKYWIETGWTVELKENSHPKLSEYGHIMAYRDLSKAVIGYWKNL